MSLVSKVNGCQLLVDRVLTCHGALENRRELVLQLRNQLRELASIAAHAEQQLSMQNEFVASMERMLAADVEGRRATDSADDEFDAFLSSFPEVDEDGYTDEERKLLARLDHDEIFDTSRTAGNF